MILRQTQHYLNALVIKCPHNDSAETPGFRLQVNIFRGVSHLHVHIAASTLAVLFPGALIHAGYNEHSRGILQKRLPMRRRGQFLA